MFFYKQFLCYNTNMNQYIDKKYQNIWVKAESLLKGIGKKDYVLHSKMVSRAMSELIKTEGGDPDVLIPASILHDIGWVNVPDEKRFPKTEEEKKESERLHIEMAPDLIKQILSELDYSEELIERIIKIVISHKSKNPENNEIACMVDADNLSDTYEESFYSDIISYKSTPEKTYDFRSHNKFFTVTANQIFLKQLQLRLEEIKTGKAQKMLSSITNLY